VHLPAFLLFFGIRLSFDCLSASPFILPVFVGFVCLFAYLAGLLLVRLSIAVFIAILALPLLAAFIEYDKNSLPGPRARASKQPQWRIVVGALTSLRFGPTWPPLCPQI